MLGTITAIFIGKDVSMGLRNGCGYRISIYTQYGCIFIKWGHGKDQSCPYGSIGKLNENLKSVC